LTPIEFHYALQDSNKENDAAVKIQYEVARYIAMHVWNSAGKSLTTYLDSPQKLGIFSWETIPVTKAQTVDEMRSEMIRIAEFFNPKKKKR
jgi:hypothetical protein